MVHPLKTRFSFRQKRFNRDQLNTNYIESQFKKSKHFFFFLTPSKYKEEDIDQLTKKKLILLELL